MHESVNVFLIGIGTLVVTPDPQPFCDVPHSLSKEKSLFLFKVYFLVESKSKTFRWLKTVTWSIKNVIAIERKNKSQSKALRNCFAFNKWLINTTIFFIPLWFFCNKFWTNNVNALKFCDFSQLLIRNISVKRFGKTPAHFLYYGISEQVVMPKIPIIKDFLVTWSK